MKDLVELTLDLLTKLLFSTYTSNYYLLYSVLHHADFFIKLKETDFSKTNIRLINDLIDHLMHHIDDEKLHESIWTYCKTFKFSFEPDYTIFKKTAQIEFHQDSRRWEECMMPHIWAEIANRLIDLPSVERVLLFKV